MKKLIVLFLFLPIAIVRGQSTNAPVVQPISTNSPAVQAGSTNVEASILSDPLSLDLSRQVQPSVIEPLQPRPNEMTLGRVRASGIAIEATKTKQPLRLINPFFPPTNSSPEDNVVRDPFDGKVNGLKVFGISF
jgi:hypothetical protein